jgi:AAHS family 4-hydroxybenzoate transporter-like MFS transporter
MSQADLANENGVGTVDPGVPLEDLPWTFAHRLTVGLCSLALLVEGFDATLTSLAAPVIAKAWGIPRTDFATAFASGSLGMALGTVLGGVLGDRIGRKPALITCTLTFTVMTLAIAMTHGVGALAIVRFAAGLGMGAALPNVTALTSESTPKKGRSIALSLVALAPTAGGLTCALLAAWILDRSVWQSLYVIGGGASLLLAMVLLYFVRESPTFLLQRSSGPTRVRRGLAQAGEFPGAAITRLFAPELRGDTVFLWFGAFVFFIGLGSLISWGPSMLVGVGYSPGTAGLGLSAYQAGSALGAISAGFLLNRYGSRLTLWTSMLVTTGWLALATFLPVLTISQTVMLAYLGVAGFLLVLSATLVFLVSAFVYAPSIRATGIGASAAVGRAGGILSSYSGAAVLKNAGPPLFFALLSILSLLAALSLPLLKRHVPVPKPDR